MVDEFNVTRILTLRSFRERGLQKNNSLNLPPTTRSYLVIITTLYCLHRRIFPPCLSVQSSFCVYSSFNQSISTGNATHSHVVSSGKHDNKFVSLSYFRSSKPNYKIIIYYHYHYQMVSSS